jgi:hypothetical protein
VRRNAIRIARTTMALAGLAAAWSAPTASADATLKFAPDNAACVAQAWVPFNTDPEVAPGGVGDLLNSSSDYNPRKGELRQDECVGPEA